MAEEEKKSIEAWETELVGLADVEDWERLEKNQGYVYTIIQKMSLDISIVAMLKSPLSNMRKPSLILIEQLKSMRNLINP